MLRKVPETIIFKHKFSLPLYKLILRYQFKKYNYTARISIEDLRTFLDIEENKYKLYGDLKRHLVKSLEELQGKTKLAIELKERKTGRKVTSIVFMVEQTS